MEEQSKNPCRLVIFTNHPEEAATYEAQGWTLSTVEVLKFQPGLNPDLLNPKRYALKMWKPEPEKQPNLL
jgi:hypothetical protein